MIVKYRCDIQMAEKKNIRKYCNKKCNECLCGIGMDEWGREEHVGDMLQGCGNIMLRNLAHLRGGEHD